MESAQVKTIIYKLGVDICGIASVDRFCDAPARFHPRDIYDKCNSVIVYGIKAPSEVLFIKNTLPYTNIQDRLEQHLDYIGLKAARLLEEYNIKAIPMPTDKPYEYFDQTRQHGQALLSMRHAAWLAGLGVLGKNTLLINDTYGNLLSLGAILIDAPLESDSLADYLNRACPENCRLCLDSCPHSALDGKTVDQWKCRPMSNYKIGNNFNVKICNMCRKVCPSALSV